MKKRIFCLLLAVLLLTSACGKSEPERLCEEIDVNSLAKVEGNVFQSLYKWSDGRAKTDIEPTSDYETDRYLVTYQSNEALIDQYVAMLTENGFTLVEKNTDSYICDYRWKLWCDSAPDARILRGYTDTHIAIEGYEDGSFYFYFSGDLEMQNLGLRMDGDHVNIYETGPSAGAGLDRLKDGSFQTTDGRLTASMGTATVIRDGAVLNGKAHYFGNTNDWVYVDDYYRNEDFFFAVKADYSMSGDYYWLHDFRGSYSKLNGTAMDVVIFNNSSVPLFILTTDGKRCGTSTLSFQYESLFVRVMYFEEDVVAVYYVYAKVNGAEPAEIEALFAVDMTPQKQETSSSSGSSNSDRSESTCSACSGDGRCNMCGGSGRVNRWVGDSYVLQNCTGVFCSGGRCNQCGGDGKN